MTTRRTSGPSGRSKSHAEREADGKRHVGVWIDADTRRRLETMAAVDDMSLAWEVEMAIEARFWASFAELPVARKPGKK